MFITVLLIIEKKKTRNNQSIDKRIDTLSVSQSVSSVAQSCLTLCDPMNCITPGLPVHHQLPEFWELVTYRYSKQKIRKTTAELNSITNQLNIIDIYIEYFI